MKKEDKDQAPEQPSLRQRSPEKIIQPLNPDLTSSEAAPRVHLSAGDHNNIATSSYDPTDENSYRVATLDLHRSSEESSVKTVAMKHKSLMILAVLGLLSAFLSVVSVLRINSTLNDTGTAQAALIILYCNILFNVLISLYFLMAKNRHTVATVLKILIVLEFISVFGIFWGAAPTKGIDLFINGALLLYTYIVFNIVKTAPAI